MALTHLNENDFNDFIAKNELSVVDFYATWCPPCKMLAPIMEEIGDQAKGFQVAKIDIDQAIEVANEYGVMSIPTLIFFKDGKELQRLVGFRNKDEIMQEINKTICWGWLWMTFKNFIPHNLQPIK